MGHIHTKPGQHDLTASAFIFRTDGAEPKVLMHQHKKLGKWMHFGGHVELHENLWQALTHEIREESGYELPQLRLLQPRDRLQKMDEATLIPQPIFVMSVGYYGIQDKNHFHDDLTFAFVTSEEPVGKVAIGESEDFKWFSRDEFAALTNEETFLNLRQGGLHAFDLLDSWEQVPAPSIST